MATFITLEQLLKLHVIVINHSGGSQGVRDMGRLDAAVAVQAQEVFGEELYKSIYEKSAAIIRGIIGDHPFVDGNKRTGMLAGLTLLEVNDIKVSIKKGDLEDFAVRVAVDKLDVAEIARWLEAKSRLKK